MKINKTAPQKKELRILFTPEHYERLEAVAESLDSTAAALVRMWAMEKVRVHEALDSQKKSLSFLQGVQEFTERMEEMR